MHSKAKSFAYNYINTSAFNENNSTTINSFNLNYYKISATLDFEIKKRVARSKITQHIGYTNTNLFVDNETYQIDFIDSSQSSIGLQNKATVINNFYYSLQNNRTINPFDVAFNFQHNDQFGKASATFNYAITFKNKNTLDFRLFAGAFVYKANNLREDYRFRMSGFNGAQDYLFDYNYAGRNEIYGVPAAQMVEKDGAFKVPTIRGQSSLWLVALNIKSPKVGKLPLKLFMDIGATEFNSISDTDRFLYDVGVDICLWKNVFEIYVPFAYSKDIKTTLQVNNKDSFFDTIRFTLNLHNINPRNLLTSSFL